MLYLNEITTELNKLFAAETFTDKRFASSDYNALAYPVLVDNRKEQEQIQPCVPTTVGEYKPLMFDDAKALIVYHKVLNNPITSEKDKEGFGRISGRNLKSTGLMQMIVLANRALIKVLPADLASLFIMNFPDGSETAFSSISNSLQGITIRPSSCDLNYERLWAQEFKGFDFEVNPDRAILSVNYTIESAFKTKCFKLCDCAGESGQ